MIEGLCKRWRVAEPHAEARALADALRTDPLVGQMLMQRGITQPAAAERFFEPTLNDLHDPLGLPNIETAAGRIVNAVKNRETIVLYGDYDVDGIAGLAILFHILKAADPDADVRRYIPHRIDEGYGLNSEAIAKLADAGADLIVTVDCGITAVEPAAVARQHGVDLIITDHHALADALPEAFSVVHPRLTESTYPFEHLCGAAVAYKLAWQVARTWCGSERVSQTFRELLVHALALAALGTVADVVPLIGENRVIVHCGLARIKHTPFAGLGALIDASRLRDEAIDAYHVGFVIGPRLNACGRMGHAKLACKLLTTAEGDDAREIAEFLNRENDKRRAVERRIFDQAKQRVAERGDDGDDVRLILLDDEQWHPGVVGIVCSRLVEAFGRPAILLNTANGVAQGSGRSIDGYNLHEALCACAAHMETFGGHAMAAGLKVRRENIDALREAMVAHAREHIAVEDLVPRMELDAAVGLADLSTAAVERLETMGPFGRGNPSPKVMVSGVQIGQDPTPLGRSGKHMAMIVRDPRGGAALRCVGWNLSWALPKLAAGMIVDLAGRPKINRWRGRANVELELLDLRIAG